MSKKCDFLYTDRKEKLRLCAMKVIVIGAGMVGDIDCVHLQKNNSKVLLIDKKSPGSKTFTVIGLG